MPLFMTIFRKNIDAFMRIGKMERAVLTQGTRICAKKFNLLNSKYLALQGVDLSQKLRNAEP